MKTIWALGIAAILVTGAVAQTKKPVKAPPKKPTKVQAKTNKLKDVKKEAKGIRNDLHDIRVKSNVVSSDIEWVNGRLNTISSQLKKTQLQLTKAKSEQTIVQRELDVVSAEMTQTKMQVKSRIRSMYKQGDEPMLMVLIGSTDASSFASRKAFLERISKRDKDLFTKISKQREIVAQKKRRKDELFAEVDDLRKRQKTEQSHLAEANGDKKELLRNLNHQESTKEKELNELEQESNRLEQEIRTIQNAGSKGGFSVVPFRGGLSRPVNGRMTSGFGYRIHPISHVRKLHAGVDFGAPTGTPIHAAAPGVVIVSGTMRGYGNAVVIDHGGGLSTLYGHCSKLLVNRGQRVTAGQLIAKVGSTGYSTGPHLHFETRINGTPVNPLSRL